MKKIRNLIANVILVVLSVALVVNVSKALEVVSDINEVFITDEKALWWYISNDEYGDIVLASWENRTRTSDTENVALEQCYAVADYFEAASLYKVAVETGNVVEKTKYKSIMDEKIKYMNDILYVAESIHEKLDIE